MLSRWAMHGPLRSLGNSIDVTAIAWRRRFSLLVAVYKVTCCDVLYRITE